MDDDTATTDATVHPATVNDAADTPDTALPKVVRTRNVCDVVVAPTPSMNASATVGAYVSVRVSAFSFGGVTAPLSAWMLMLMSPLSQVRLAS